MFEKQFALRCLQNYLLQQPLECTADIVCRVKPLEPETWRPIGLINKPHLTTLPGHVSFPGILLTKHCSWNLKLFPEFFCWCVCVCVWPGCNRNSHGRVMKKTCLVRLGNPEKRPSFPTGILGGGHTRCKLRYQPWKSTTKKKTDGWFLFGWWYLYTPVLKEWVKQTRCHQPFLVEQSTRDPTYWKTSPQEGPQQIVPASEKVSLEDPRRLSGPRAV